MKVRSIKRKQCSTVSKYQFCSQLWQTPRILPLGWKIEGYHFQVFKVDDDAHIDPPTQTPSKTPRFLQILCDSLIDYWEQNSFTCRYVCLPWTQPSNQRLRYIRSVFIPMGKDGITEPQDTYLVQVGMLREFVVLIACTMYPGIGVRILGAVELSFISSSSSKTSERKLVIHVERHSYLQPSADMPGDFDIYSVFRWKTDIVRCENIYTKGGGQELLVEQKQLARYR